MMNHQKLSDAQYRQKQIEDAQTLIGDRLTNAGFAKGLFFGEYLADRLTPYPDLEEDEEANALVGKLSEFCVTDIDPVSIDRDARIPDSVIRGLGELGILGACLPKESGGLELSQTSYCRLLEVLGGHCGSTALFVNAHHSIGPRAIVLFGTDEQKLSWLPKMATGEWISAFALTEPEAGSDAANVQTTATPVEDGAAYLLNGEKRWITNGGIAKALIVMARTPGGEGQASQVTAFQVDAAMPGFEVVEARMEKLGVRGTATSRLRFTEMRVPRENLLGPLGKGLRVALTVLDFGRTTFGATCTGAAKVCCQRSVEHARQRVQFGRPLAAFELVKEKIAYMHAGVYAMEACTYQTAALIDSGQDDYMLETAMLKVFNTEVLWRILNDTFQIHGGMAYFCDQPFERMIRDARINTIGEGSNDVLRPFISLVGLRDVGLELQSILEAAMRPARNLGRLGHFAGRRLERLFSAPAVPVRNSLLADDARRLGESLARMSKSIERLLRTHQEEILDRQYHLARVADASMLLYASSCVLSRLDQLLSDRRATPQRKQQELAAGRHFLLTSQRRIANRLAATKHNDDEQVSRFADSILNGYE